MGEAPAPQLTDRPRSPPQRGNGRERLPPPAAHGHMRTLHDLQPGSVAEAGARVQASIEGLEPVFSTCSDARSSTNCCRRWAASEQKDGSIFGDPVLLSAEGRTGAGPTEMTLGNRSTALSVPHRSARPPPAAPGLPFQSAPSASGRCTLSVLTLKRSQAVLPPDGAESSHNALAAEPTQSLSAGGRRGEWAWEAARCCGGAESDAKESRSKRPRGAIHGVDHPTRGGLLQQSHKIV